MKGLIINKYGLSHVEKYVHPMEIVGNFDIFEHANTLWNSALSFCRNFHNKKQTKKTDQSHCHGAHSREEQGHPDEDVNSNNSL